MKSRQGPLRRLLFPDPLGCSYTRLVMALVRRVGFVSKRTDSLSALRGNCCTPAYTFSVGGRVRNMMNTTNPVEIRLMTTMATWQMFFSQLSFEMVCTLMLQMG